MNDTQPAGERQPLWSDQRIGDALVKVAYANGEVSGESIMLVVYGIRNHYEAERATLQQENAQLLEKIEQLEAELAALRAEQRYVPVEDGLLDDHTRLMNDGKRIWQIGSLFGKDRTNNVFLPDDLRLCRLVPGQDGQQ